MPILGISERIGNRGKPISLLPPGEIPQDFRLSILEEQPAVSKAASAAAEHQLRFTERPVTRHYRIVNPANGGERMLSPLDDDDDDDSIGRVASGAEAGKKVAISAAQRSEAWRGGGIPPGRWSTSPRRAAAYIRWLILEPSGGVTLSLSLSLSLGNARARVHPTCTDYNSLDATCGARRSACCRSVSSFAIGECCTANAWRKNERATYYRSQGGEGYSRCYTHAEGGRAGTQQECAECTEDSRNVISRRADFYANLYF